MISHRLRLVAATTFAVTSGTVLMSSSPVSADITGYVWSANAGTIQQGTNSNRVGFWQTVGLQQGIPVCPATNSIDGIFGAKTKTQTQRMQTELATPPISATGIVNAATWNAIQNAGSVYGPRLSRINGTPGNHGDFEYYSGQAGDNAQLFWQGNDTGTSMWKFKPPGASTHINATTARTMGSYSIPCQ